MRQKTLVVNTDRIGWEVVDGRNVTYGIEFDRGRAGIKPESRSRIEQLARLLATVPDLDAVIIGHTEGLGPFGHKLSLSRRRARAVVKALISLGVAAKRLMPVGAVMSAASEASQVEGDDAGKHRTMAPAHYSIPASRIFP